MKELESKFEKYRVSNGRYSIPDVLMQQTLCELSELNRYKGIIKLLKDNCKKTEDYYTYDLIDKLENANLEWIEHALEVSNG